MQISQAGNSLEAADEVTKHGDPIAPVSLGVIVLLLAAIIDGSLFEAAGQPAVPGELIVGVILMLFQVGLESSITQMKKVGLSVFLSPSWQLSGP